MKIRITPDARRWIVDHGGAVMLRLSTRHGCCGATAMVPLAEPGAPEDERGHRRERVDGVDVYLDEGVEGEGAQSEGVVTIDLAGFWRWRRLVVDGLEIRAGG
ncbi:MAG: hypothetical protein JJU33_11255 [Phycisphaerales bacterium]|nr:hypothetical protein [Phycisphaerales bacterium]